jgi:hypothetical protein
VSNLGLGYKIGVSVLAVGVDFFTDQGNKGITPLCILAAAVEFKLVGAPKGGGAWNTKTLPFFFFLRSVAKKSKP